MVPQTSVFAPTFDPPKELLEPHFFDFAEDLYGQTIEIEFHAFHSR